VLAPSADLSDWKTEPEDGYTLLGFPQQQDSLPWLPKQLRFQIIKSQMLDTAHRFARG